ncbi:MAG TPA: NADPH:quinone oxidoreductase [Actinobacteria bacterium]|jgi:putative PIG3 family NAD(P)H quinone oxidoreductase|nr:NADPH:quinone oxidoreductase [Actinomycetota bacterium]
MHAITVTEPGGPEAMSWAKVPDPTPGPGEVIVEVAAAGVNRADLLQRQGLYPPPPGASDIIGLECSGTITNVGAALPLDRIGEKVCAILAGGGYAQKVAVPVGQLMPIPDGVSLIDAGGLAEVTCTVWSNLDMVANLSEGEWLLIHGGGSGVGTMAIQIGRALGARIAVTAGSQAKLDRCAALGAEVLINYHEQDFVQEIKDATGGRGANVILDNMGASYLSRNVDALARDGRLVVIGMQGGVKAELDINALLRKNASVHATSLRGRPESEKAAICAQVERTVWPWIHAGVVTPVIDRVMPMADAAEAHRLLADGAVTGKILLTP